MGTIGRGKKLNVVLPQGEAEVTSRCERSFNLEKLGLSSYYLYLLSFTLLAPINPGLYLTS